VCWRLEHLSSIGAPDDYKDKACSAFWQFLANHPPLHCFSYIANGVNPKSQQLVTALLQLKQQRPQLLVFEYQGSFLEAILSLDAYVPPDAALPLPPNVGEDNWGSVQLSN
jgi:hypothetical protein